MLRVLERQLIYFPSPLPREMPPPDLAHGAAEDAYLTTEDGVTVHGWYVTARGAPERGEGARPVVLHFHGNAGNILDRADHVDALAARGLDVFILSYRGYGKSEGAPSEAGLYRDAEAAYAYLV
ncbi:MAG: alpha/beta hydrolase, partial [Gemmatimonadota bacterium]